MLLVVSSKKNVPIEIFNQIFESTQNKQHFDAKITHMRKEGKKVMVIKNLLQIFVVLPESQPKYIFALITIMQASSHLLCSHSSFENTPKNVTNINCYNFFHLSFMEVLCYPSVAYSVYLQIL